LFAASTGVQGSATAESLPSANLPGLSADQARMVNASIPVSGTLNPAAQPFVMPSGALLDQTRAVDCLTAAVYYESAGEPLEGQQAVAQVILNRMRHPAFPKSVCGVVFEGSNRGTGCQFTFTCDGSMNRVPSPTAWTRARHVAEAALGGFVMKAVGDATHYHADYVVPYWATTLTKIGKVGTQIFYRWNGGWGAPGAFKAPYAGAEPSVDLSGAVAAQTPGLDQALATANQLMAAKGEPTVTAVGAAIAPPAVQASTEVQAKPVAASSAATPAPAAPKTAAPKPAPAKPEAPETITAGPAWERR